jgi:pimeloyl-ACP methyl ester carboxylesterase
MKVSRPIQAIALAIAVLASHPAHGAEELISTAKYASGEPIPYVLDSEGSSPKYVIILFPGGAGTFDPRMENGRLVYGYGRNFLVRSRKFLVDAQFATVTTNATQSEQRIQAVLDDIGRRFPDAKIYLMGTSNGTGSTMALAAYLADKIAGAIHTASWNSIYTFDSRKYKNRHLIVHHKRDACQFTLFSTAKASHERYGTRFIAMEGGVSIGDPCEALAYHGFNGFERETMSAIKQWILEGG